MFLVRSQSWDKLSRTGLAGGGGGGGGDMELLNLRALVLTYRHHLVSFHWGRIVNKWPEV